jgi:ADP-heptose:LPS heptosyltransferase
MHTIEIIDDTLVFDNVKLTPGTYWAEDHNAAQLLHEGGGYGRVRLRHSPPPHQSADCLHGGQTITVVRVGGFGDLLWMNAVYDALKAKHPGISIRHACLPRYAPVLLGYADRVDPYPIRQPDMNVENHIYWLENIIEAKPCRGTEHPCDRIAARFGLDPLPRKAAYHLTDKERKWARDRLRAWTKRRKPKGEPLRIGVHLGGSGIHKIKSYEQIGKVMAVLLSDYTTPCELVTVGDPVPEGQAVNVPADVYHCPAHRHTIRESIALISTCDAILAPDSVFVHVGAALDIPVVGLYGPFDGQAYMQGQRGEAIQGVLRCSPCSHHLRTHHMPPDGPCAKSGVCDALEQLDIAHIVKTTLKWAEEGRNTREAVR